jgi:PadR family transcriptional regulator AphA
VSTPKISRELNSTSFALLALLAVRPFTTYELAQQMNNTLRSFWPRAESMLYEEPKKLVARGLATSTPQFTGRRRGTVYEITTAGRQALRGWLDEPASGMSIEFEALIKVAFADHGDKTQLQRTLRAIRTDAEQRRTAFRARCADYVETGGPFPQRLPIIALTVKLLAEQAELLERWAGWAEQVVADWPGVTPATGATAPSEAFTTGWLPDPRP